MEHLEIHELSAAYALNALDEHDEREFEEHLRRCERCRQDLPGLQEAASALAYGVPQVSPPPGLRNQILERIREEGATREERASGEERAVILPLRRRPLPMLTGALAAVAACTAIGLGIWSLTLSDSLGEKDELLSVLSDPGARAVPVSGTEGRLVIASGGRAALVLTDIREAPREKTYEVWVVERGKPTPAGLFSGRGGRETLVLEHPVPPGAKVAVTIEREGGVDAPEGPRVLSAQT